MTSFIRKFRILSVAVVLSTLLACSPDATVPSGSGAQTEIRTPVDSQSPAGTPTVSASSQNPKPTNMRSTPPLNSQAAEPTNRETLEPVQPLPQEFEGLWTSVGQGSAETICRFRNDGSDDKVSILLQQRPSGTFSFITTAQAEIAGDRLTLTPVEGTQAMLNEGNLDQTLCISKQIPDSGAEP